MIKVKIKVFGRDGKDVKRLNEELAKDFVISNKPDIIISYGGDGTLLLSERLYPGIPKLPVRNRNKCYKCSEYGLHSKGKIKEILKKRKYKIVNLMKIEAKTKGKKIIAFNDIIIRNKNQMNALRFAIKTNKKNFKEVIGDGVVIATPFGSSGYFNSITRKKFKKGIGIAFNNPLYYIRPWILNDNSEIEIRILREKAELSADNNEKTIILNENDIVKIRKSKEKARLVMVNNGLL